jgi:mannose-6-phosphate isomerase-like protein (cupin superfamily)
MSADLVSDPVFRTRYRFTRTTDDDGTEVQHVEMWVDPGGGVTPHIHHSMEERFTVVEGRPEFLAGRRWQSADPGQTVVVPAGTRHAFRNRGDEVAHVRCEARPPSSLQEFLEQVAGLSRAGKLSRLGVPKLGGVLDAIALAHHHREMVELLFPSPPPALQRVLLPPLARIAARRGHHPGTFAQLA